MFTPINIGLTTEKIAQATRKAVHITTQQALKDCNYYCKQDTSVLINSSIIHSDFEKGIIKWQTPYAKKQYYLKRTLTEKNPQARWMWAHYAKSVHKKEWFKMFEKACKRFANE